MTKNPRFGARFGAQGLGGGAWAVGGAAWAVRAQLGNFPSGGLAEWKIFDSMQSRPHGNFLEFFSQAAWELNTLGVSRKKLILSNQVFSGVLPIPIGKSPKPGVGPAPNWAGRFAPNGEGRPAWAPKPRPQLGGWAPGGFFEFEKPEIKERGTSWRFQLLQG